MSIFKTPKIAKWLTPKLVWNIPVQSKTIFLTFDDGPVASITDDVLSILADYNAKATFFCVGDNIRKYPDVFQRIIREHHKIGNHTYHHLNGWKNSNQDYLHDIKVCDQIIEQNYLARNYFYFRPPYGKITPKQIKLIRSHQIIMWDVLSRDYDPSVSAEKCLQKSIKHTRPGSIILFHDSIKTMKKLEFVLPKYLAHFTDLGYKFLTL